MAARYPATPRKAFTLEVELTLWVDGAREERVRGSMVIAHGVRLSEVDPSTRESRVSPSLFLCGETLDVDGRPGGLSFQWSWSSGTVAGRAATST